MPDTYVTLANRLLSRCPVAGIALSQQLINDAWHTLQSRREWSWRRRIGQFQPVAVYSTGTVSTNVSAGQPTLISGVGTVWTTGMIGRQIRIAPTAYPYMTIIGWRSATEILVDQPWTGTDVTAQPYTISKAYYETPSDFGYFHVVASPRDNYQLWTSVTQTELAMCDAQRAYSGQTYAAAFRDYSTIYGGVINTVVPVAAVGASPVSTTTTGYSYVADASYIIRVVLGGASGVATWQWMRSGQAAFTPAVLTDVNAQDLMDGVQVYWPAGVVYQAGDLFVVNARAAAVTGGPRYELWPVPTDVARIYPYIYIARESDISDAAPTLPPMVANRGEVLLEMALASCARYPGPDANTRNPYFNLALAGQHEVRAERMLADMERNDEEIGVTNVAYQQYPMAPAPWLDGSYRQTHAPFYAG